MKTNDTIDLKSYWNKAIDYNTYINNTEESMEKKDSFENYYKLNLQRMQRLEKKLKFDEETKSAIAKINRNVNLLVITEGWCGDAAQIIPVLNKLAVDSEKISIRFIYRDENEDLINAYLTNGGKSIPIVIGLDAETHQQVFKWGPRPEFGNILLEKYKKGEMSKEYFQLDLQKAYNKDKGKTIIQEIVNEII